MAVGGYLVALALAWVGIRNNIRNSIRNDG